MMDWKFFSHMIAPNSSMVGIVLTHQSERHDEYESRIQQPHEEEVDQS